MTASARSGSIERLSAADLLPLRTDVGPVPMNIGAVLTFGGGASASQVERALRRRIATVPRLQQVLETPPPGLGRPYWRDDPAFDAGNHVSRHLCRDGDIDTVLAVAAGALAQRLPTSHPLWRAVVVSPADDGDALAVVIVLHHVLADGLGGLALLEHLVDEADGSAAPTPGRPSAPTARDLLVDRSVILLRTLRALPAALRPALTRARRGWTELGHAGGQRAPRTSLNRPTGPRRSVSAVTVELESVRESARRRGVSVNDVLLVAVTGAMAEVLRARGELVAELCVSVPVSGRPSSDGHLGNRVGVMPVRVPLSGSPTERLLEVGRRTRAQKTRVRGESAALIGPAFRLLAVLGVFSWFIQRQHLVNSFLSNVPGPARPLMFCGAHIEHVVPLAVTAGNIGVAFAALSYAGELTVSVITDPEVVPELDVLACALRSELRALSARAVDDGT
jgi:WS/DGAT/MGAT family acyltransferase